MLDCNDISQNITIFQACLYPQKVNSPKFVLLIIVLNSKLACMQKKGISLKL